MEIKLQTMMLCTVCDSALFSAAFLVQLNCTANAASHQQLARLGWRHLTDTYSTTPTPVLGPTAKPLLCDEAVFETWL